MSLFSKLVETLFRKQRTKNIEPNFYWAEHGKRQKERMNTIEANIKGWLSDILKQNGSLDFSWESGNDEAFVTFKGNNNAEEDTFSDLEEYIIEKLEIPDAGEFQMNGNGSIYVVDNLVRAKYASIAKAIVDFDEEAEQEIYGEEEHDSGDKVLFII